MFYHLREHLEYLLRPNRYLNVDALRACAVLMVVCHHIGTFIPAFQHGAIGDFCRFGARGVDLFFVISGFLFGSMLVGELTSSNTIDFRRFYRHRFLRIVPLYWFTTIISIPLCFWVGWCSATSLPIVPRQFFLDLTFLHTLQGSKTAMQAWASWSLAVEMWFYLFIPIVLVWLYRLSKHRENVLTVMIGFLALGGLLLRASVVLHGHSPLTDNVAWWAVSRPYARFDELLIGMFAYLIGRRISPSTGKAILIFGGVVLIAAYEALAKPAYAGPTELVIDCVFMPTVLSIGFAAVLIGTVASKFQHPAVTFIANLSYSLYLMHALVTMVVSTESHSQPFAVVFVFVSMALAYIASAFVEYPFLKIYKRPVPPSEKRMSRILAPMELGSNLSIAASRTNLL